MSIALRPAPVLALSLGLLLAGCASLPTSGPTAGQVTKALRPEANTIGMRMVDIDAASIARITDAEAANDATNPTLASLNATGRNDVVGPGDTLAISVYEVGVTLFGAQSQLQGFDPSAKAQTFPQVVVARDGTIKLPYIGSLQVGGRTTDEIQAMIETAYRGKSQTPQALVAVKSNLSETVYVTGDVRRPGRIELSLQNERLLDAVAQAGGAVSRTQDMVVRFSRGGRTVDERLDRIRSGAANDLVLMAGDRINLINEPQTFTTFGAANKVAQIPFDQTNLSLAEALARVGGPSDASANPRSVFLFRYAAPDTPGGPAVPTIYRFNMMNPTTYFLAQRMAVRNKDVLYVSNAAINKTAKFVSILNQLFSPFVTAAALSNSRL